MEESGHEAGHFDGRSSTFASTSNVPLPLPKLIYRPDDIKKLNVSVWEFYEPPDRDQVPPKLDVLFFHGAQLSNDPESFWKTWLSRDETVVWPTAWLAPKFTGARMLFISYDSLQKSSGQMDVDQIIENLRQDIIWSSTCKAGQKCPVILVGHCFGGIIIKDFLIKCSEYSAIKHAEDLGVKDIKIFLQQCKGIFCYSTPNAGSRLKDGLAYQDYILSNVNQSTLDFLETLSQHTARINSKFSDLRHNQHPQWTTRGIEERLKTNLGNSRKIMVVPEASARQDMDRIYWANADHFNVSRAQDNSTCIIFTGLFDLISDLDLTGCHNELMKDEISNPPRLMGNSIKPMDQNQNHSLVEPTANATDQNLVLQENVPLILTELGRGDQATEKISNLPRLLDKLIKSMDQDQNPELAKRAARDLRDMTATKNPRIKREISYFPNLLESLGASLSKGEISALQENAAWALGDLGLLSDPSINKKVFALPGLLENLVKSVHQDQNFVLAERAARVIRTLAATNDSIMRAKISCVPNLLETLVVSLLKYQNPALQENAALAFFELGFGDQATKEKIFQLPGLLDNLIKCVEQDKSSNLRLAEKAAGAIRNLTAIKNSTIKHEIACFPNLLESLGVSLSKDENSALQKNAAWALGDLGLLSNQSINQKIFTLLGLSVNLVKAMHQDQYLGLAERAARVIRTLAANKDSTMKGKITCVPKLLETYQNPPLQENTALTFTGLGCGDQATKEKLFDLPGLLSNLLKAVDQDQNHRLAEHAVGAIANLAATKDSTLKSKLACFPHLMESLKVSLTKGQNSTLQKNAARAIANLGNRDQHCQA